MPVYWRCTPTVVDALLDIAGLIDDQYRTRIAECVDHIVAQIIADRIGVPLRPRQQMLQSVRAERSPRCSAIVQQFLRSRPDTMPSISPPACRSGSYRREPRRDPVDHRAELGPPPIRVYAVSRGDRGSSRCPHKLRTMPRVTASTSANTPHKHQGHDLRLQY